MARDLFNPVLLPFLPPRLASFHLPPSVPLSLAPAYRERNSGLTLRTDSANQTHQSVGTATKNRGFQVRLHRELAERRLEERAID